MLNNCAFGTYRAPATKISFLSAISANPATIRIDKNTRGIIRKRLASRNHRLPPMFPDPRNIFRKDYRPTGPPVAQASGKAGTRGSLGARNAAGQTGRVCQETALLTYGNRLVTLIETKWLRMKASEE